MKKVIVMTFGVVACLVMVTACYADQTIVTKKVASAPVIDGRGNDPVWAQAIEYATYDNVAKINITLKAVYTDTEIFFLVSYPDKDESITHKSWVWDKDKEMYKVGPDREDLINFKWNMEPNIVDLSLKSDDNYMSDDWFWKAYRTNPAGYADDKYQRLSANEIPKSAKLVSKTGKTMYLIRDVDKGTPCYKDTLYTEYQGDKMPGFTYVTPTGSCADIKAKGVWSGGKWTIELGRALKTGNADDIQFDTSKSYQFGVSRYEISGRPPDPTVDQPLYNSGDISEALTLTFGQ